MGFRQTSIAAGVLIALVALVVPAQAQQVSVATPFHSGGDSFFESNSINWSGQYNFLDSSSNHAYRGQGITFSYGGGALARPQFGSPDPSAGLSTAFALLGKNGQINFNLNFSQGYKQSLVTQTPSVTLMNGQTGYVSDTSQTPFVISVVPVVGAFPTTTPQELQEISGLEPSGIDPRVQALLQVHADAQAQAARAEAGGPPLPQQPQPNKLAPRQNAKPAPDPLPAAPEPAAAASQRLDAAQESTAGRPAPSVAEARRLHQQELAKGNGEMEAVMERARALEEDGKPNVAKIYYQQVAKHASGELQQQARAKLYELQSPGKP